MLLRVLRILRILRILRLLKGAKDLRDLIVTMVLSFPSLLNVGSLLALILFIFSVLGVTMFTFVAHGDPISDAHGGISSMRNFDTLGNAFLVLLQCLTGDGWSTVMADAMKSEESGRCSEDAGDCGSVAAIPFFISFQVRAALLLASPASFSPAHFTSSLPLLLISPARTPLLPSLHLLSTSLPPDHRLLHLPQPRRRRHPRELCDALLCEP